jgi:hypothetical protein
MSESEATDSDGKLQLMLAAAAAVDSRFKIMVMPDMTALGGDANAITGIIKAVAHSPAAYKLADGRLVVSAFAANMKAPTWWSAIFSSLKAGGINVAFVPTFMGWTQYADQFASISYGFADWGTATAYGAGYLQDDASIAHDYGKKFMMPIDGQQYRPKNYQFWEAGGSAAFRTGWMDAVYGGAENGADLAQLVTWNDYSESSQTAPYTDITLNRSIGTGYYDLIGYYASWFMTNKQPAITHDVLYYFYRREPTTAKAPSQSQINKATSTVPPENDIELLAFLTSPGVLKVTIGTNTYTKNAAAGIVSFKVPLATGTPLFTLSRNGADVFSFKGGVQIYGSGGLPSGTADLTYWSGSASKNGICSL